MTTYTCRRIAKRGVGREEFTAHVHVSYCLYTLADNNYTCVET